MVQQPLAWPLPARYARLHLPLGSAAKTTMATGVPTRRTQRKPSARRDAVTSSDASPVLSYAGKRDAAEILAGPAARISRVWAPPGLGSEPESNRLYFGDNLRILRHLLADDCVRGRVRLVYIDPPFATQSAFHSRKLAPAYEDTLAGAEFIEHLRARLLLLREILAQDGSLYVHLDEKMVFHIKVILDELFGEAAFRNCVTRKKCNPKNYTRRQYGNVADYILFYSKSSGPVWNRPVEPWTESRAREYQYVEPETGRRFMKVPVHAPGTRRGATGGRWRGKLPPPGKHWQFPPQKLDELDARGEIYWSPRGNPRRKVYLDQSPGVGVQDIWLDFKDAHNQNVRITGYPTEKNPGLLERIIEASSNPGDLVLDCYAGSGTTLSVADRLGRRWIGIDASREAIATSLRRFAHGTERMGDFVTPAAKRDQTTRPHGRTRESLFDSLEAVAVAEAPDSAREAITQFVLLAERGQKRELDECVRDWRQRAAAPRQGAAAPAVAELRRAERELSRRDAKLAAVIATIGPCRLAPKSGGFEDLLDAIVSQQLSNSAAATIRKRVRGLFDRGKPSPAGLARITDPALRAAGLSRRKVEYVRSLADHVRRGVLDRQALRRMSDADAIDALCGVKGIGRWTAEMYLIFSMHRLDVFPGGDQAIRASMMDLYRLTERGYEQRAVRIAEQWRPYRSVASWYLYRHLEHSRERVHHMERARRRFHVERGA